MTKDEARELARPHQGINVRVRKGSWHFCARFHTEGRYLTKYAGKSLERALEARRYLISTHAKPGSRYRKIPRSE